MNSLIDGIRSVLGSPEFYVNGNIDYGLVTEYILGGLLLIFVVCQIFRLIFKLFGG